ncbi:hypothetical protein ACYOEI_12170 [Singulisphaera rosea]
MIVRTLLSDWVGFLLTCLMVLCVGIGLHSDNGPSVFEKALALGSLAIVGAWFAAKGSVWLHANARSAKVR